MMRLKFIDAALQEQPGVEPAVLRGAHLFMNAALQEQLGVEPAVLRGAPFVY
jgi:hypothetical protein